MIQELKMVNFKSFADQGGTIRLGGLSLIIGTNASGKSNIRDGLRFIHGIARGYSLAEIIGEKYVEGGVLQWKGIRGGVKETVYRNGNGQQTQFTIAVKTQLAENYGGGTADYSITVALSGKNLGPVVVDERLNISTRPMATFTFKSRFGPGQMAVVLGSSTPGATDGKFYLCRNDKPAVSQILDFTAEIAYSEAARRAHTDCAGFLRSIASVRFLDLDPQALRRPAIPGQTILGDKGENLASVLQAICADPAAKEALIEWTRELTPLDLQDLKFPEVSLEGKIQLQLVEAGGREISAESASDGTLRFLAFAAALLGTEPARFYFFEEIENGIHPNRAHLLVNLLRNATRGGRIQVVGTTHSPALLNFLNESDLRAASLVYRVGSASKIRNFADLPALWQVTGSARAGELHGSGWFENVAAYGEAEATP